MTISWTSIIINAHTG